MKTPAEAAEFITAFITDAFAESGISASIAPDMALIGDDSNLDSQKLVELCLALEDWAAANGFEFDWTSESAMSRSQSMFRSVTSLAEEVSEQSKAAA